MTKQEYIGIKDVDNTKVREGDIYETVTFYNGKWSRLGGVDKKSPNGKWKARLEVIKHVITQSHSGYFYPKDMRVIGNIYENKDLLIKD